LTSSGAFYYGVFNNVFDVQIAELAELHKQTVIEYVPDSERYRTLVSRLGLRR
jgi:nitrogenase subunit NifH